MYHVEASHRENVTDVIVSKVQKRAGRRKIFLYGKEEMDSDWMAYLTCCIVNEEVNDISRWQIVFSVQ